MIFHPGKLDLGLFVQTDKLNGILTWYTGITKLTATLPLSQLQRQSQPFKGLTTANVQTIAKGVAGPVHGGGIWQVFVRQGTRVHYCSTWGRGPTGYLVSTVIQETILDQQSPDLCHSRTYRLWFEYSNKFCVVPRPALVHIYWYCTGNTREALWKNPKSRLAKLV